MKSITANYVTLAAMMVVGNICFGMDPAWNIKSINVYNTRLNPNPPLSNLKIFHKKKDGLDICYAELVEADQKTPIRVNNFNPQILQENAFGKTLYIELSCGQGTTPKEVFIQNWESFYGPKKYHQVQECGVVAQGDYIDFRFGKIGDKVSESIKLYQAKSIAIIREMLAKDEQFIVAFAKKDHEKKLYRVSEYTSGSYIWWDGWRPMWSKLRWTLIPLPGELKQTTEPVEIEIDLNEDKESEPVYRRNKNITKYTTYASILLAMAYVFRNKIENFFCYDV